MYSTNFSLSFYSFMWLLEHFKLHMNSCSISSDGAGKEEKLRHKNILKWHALGSKESQNKNQCLTAWTGFAH